MAKIFTQDFFKRLTGSIAQDIEKRDYDKALSNITLALKMKATPELYYHLALCYKAKNLLPEALEAIDKAIQGNPLKDYLKTKTDLNYLMRLKTVKPAPAPRNYAPTLRQEELELKKTAKAWGDLWNDSQAEIEHFYTLWLKGKESEAKKSLKAMLTPFYEGEDLDYHYERLAKLPIPLLMVKKLGERGFSLADFNLAAMCFSYLAALEPGAANPYAQYLEHPKIAAAQAKAAKELKAGDYVVHIIKKYTAVVIACQSKTGRCELITNHKAAESRQHDKKITAHPLQLKPIDASAVHYCWNCFELLSEHTSIICKGPHKHTSLKDRCFTCGACGTKSHEHWRYK